MTRPPSLSNPRYVAARIRKLLRAAGLPIYEVVDRYPRQHVYPGILVQRVGVCKKVMVSFGGSQSFRDWQQHEVQKLEQALGLIRAAGYPLDDYGVIRCQRYS